VQRTYAPAAADAWRAPSRPSGLEGGLEKSSSASSASVALITISGAEPNAIHPGVFKAAASGCDGRGLKLAHPKQWRIPH